MRIVVTGAGGFIGHHLVSRLVADGHWVRGIDIKDPEFAPSRAHDFVRVDLRDWGSGYFKNIDQVFHLAANMGGIGFIETHKAEIMRDNLRIDINTLEAARLGGVKRLLFTSSACVYPVDVQSRENAAPLTEIDAYPANPEDGYGWEKLTTERLCRHFREDLGLDTRVVRFHNIFGPLGTYDGGREKSPAAICRKIALANDGDAIEVWGDGHQRRSYCYIDDCVEGLVRLMASGYVDPLNLGTEKSVSINELVATVARIAGKRIATTHDLSKPQGVRGRNSDNTALRLALKWEPSVSLEEGLAKTYAWISEKVRGGWAP